MSFSPDSDDLFNSSTMSFGEHIEELRTCLVRALIALVAGFVVGLFLGNYVVQFIKSPLEKALTEYYQEQDQRNLEKRLEEMRQAGATTSDIALYKQTIQNDGISPQLRYIDPYELAAVLHDSQTGSQQKEILTGQEPVLQMSEIEDFTALAKTLSDAKKASEASPAKRLASLLPKELQSLLEVKTDQWKKEQKSAFVAAINKILHQSDFYRVDDFENVSLTSELDTLAKMRSGDLPNFEVARLNRQLLTMAYPDLIAPYDRKSRMARLLLWQLQEDDERSRITSLNPHEMFVVYLKASLIFGGILVSPVIFYFIWEFVAAGLYPHERRYIYVFLPISIGLFLGGAALAFFFVFEPVLDFLLSFNAWVGVNPDIRFSEWMGFALFLPVGFGIAFQLPLVMLFLNRIGIFEVEAYIKNWRMAVLVIFFASMILTPSDPTSMLLMAIPLCFLYVFGIIMCQYFPKSRSPFELPEEVAA
ncbi:Sec-independent protein translocase protein TatC [Planctomycetales bacterium 10988]|nr:Sec-independent protein translocase protein TatC [Planctomycetales bacterium 10988]